MARIVSIATAAPEHRLDNAQTERLLRRILQRRQEAPEFYLRILRNAKIESRHTVYGPDLVIEDHSFGERNELYCRTCIDLGERCTLGALEQARLQPCDLATIISVSCTGHMIPAVDAHLIDRLKLSAAVRRLPITELGCAAGAMGLTRAWEQLQVYPDKHVLLLSVELPTLTFQPADHRREQLVASLIFADAAAAVVLGPTGNKPSPRLLGGRTFTIPDTIDEMGYRMDGDGLHIILSPRVPEFLRAQLGNEIDALLSDHGVARSEIRWCAMHPGGPKVIELAEQELGLTREQLAPSWTVLKQFGNASSAAVLLVLNEMMRNPTAQPGELGLIMAFGPGISGEILLARWEA
jgi:alkylresorcinol/alkylpyrone synthase